MTCGTRRSGGVPGCSCPRAPGRSGRPTFFTAVFNTFTPAIKESWISNLQMAKLALGKSGCCGPRGAQLPGPGPRLPCLAAGPVPEPRAP